MTEVVGRAGISDCTGSHCGSNVEGTGIGHRNKLATSLIDSKIVEDKEVSPKDGLCHHGHVEVLVEQALMVIGEGNIVVSNYI